MSPDKPSDGAVARLSSQYRDQEVARQMNPLYDALDAATTRKECTCTFSQRMVGDGCSVCNPTYAEDHKD